MRFQQGKVLFKVLGVVAGLIFLGYGLKERHEMSDLQEHGERAVVEPIGQFSEFKQSGSSTYTAEFHFTTKDGRQMSVKHSFPEEILEDFKSGKPVEVVYRPSDPNTFVFVGAKASWTLEVIGVVVMLAALVLA